MIDAIFWGLIQGLTEFLPISSSGHLVLIPALFGREGPDLATSALLHLGTLAAVVAYYRNDVARLIKFDRPARKVITLIIIGTIPAVILGLTFEDTLDRLTDMPDAVAVAMIVTGVILIATVLIRVGDKTMSDLSATDAGLIGLAQSLALIPGISRSGMTISAGLVRGQGRVEAARFGFLLGIPAIAGAGVFELIKLLDEPGGVTGATWVGVVVAGVTGYIAIAVLLRVLTRFGLAPFGIYCIAFGTLSLLVL